MGTPSLSDMCKAAVKRLLQNTEKGFFLMVEGARIDHAHHKNLAKKALEETVQGCRENCEFISVFLVAYCTNRPHPPCPQNLADSVVDRQMEF